VRYVRDDRECDFVARNDRDCVGSERCGKARTTHRHTVQLLFVNFHCDIRLLKNLRKRGYIYSLYSRDTYKCQKSQDKSTIYDRVAR
jgi:hypothetical protein